MTPAELYLPGDRKRGRFMRMDAASILKRFYFLVAEEVARATEADREEIVRVAEAMIEKVARIAQSSGEERAW